MDPTSDQLFKQAEISKAKDRISKLKGDMHQIGQASPLRDTFPFNVSPPKTNTASPKVENKTITLIDDMELTPKQQEVLQTAVMSYIHQKEEALDLLKGKLKVFGIDVLEKTKRKEELAKQLEEGFLEVKKTEKSVKAELKDLVEEIDSLQIDKGKDVHVFKTEKLNLQERIEKAKAQYEAISQEKANVEKHHTEIKNEGEQLFASKVAKFKKAMEPLDDALRYVESSKDTLSIKQKDEMQINQSIHAMLDELTKEMNRLINENAKLNNDRNKCFAEINTINEKFKPEYDFFFEEEESIKQLAKIEQTKEELKAKGKANESKRMQCTKLLTEWQSKLLVLQPNREALIANLNTAQNKGLEEINALEAELNKFCAQYNLPNIYQDVVKEALAKKGFDFNSELIQCQIDEVTKNINDLEALLANQEMQHNALIEKFEQEKEAIEIQFKNNANKEDASTDNNDESGEQLKVRYNALANKINTSNKEHAELREANKDKIQRLTKWRIEKISFLQPSSSDSMDNETEELVEKKVICKIEDDKTRTMFEKLYQKYRECLNRREDSIQSNMQSLLETQNAVDNIIANIEQNSALLSVLEKENSDLKAQNMTIAVNEKAINEMQEEKRGLLQFSLSKIADEKFAEYMKQNEQLFSKIKKTYGQKIMDKMVNDQRNDFIQVMQNEYLERKKRLSEHTETIKDCNEKIEVNQTQINDKIAIEIEKRNKELHASNTKLEYMNAQMQAICEAEDELTMEIEQRLAAKKVQLQNSFQAFQVKRNYEQITKQLNDLTSSLNKKSSFIASLNAELCKLCKDAQEKITAKRLEILQKKSRAEALQQEMGELQNILKPQMEDYYRQIKDYQEQITNEKRKIDYISEQIESGISEINVHIKANITSEHKPSLNEEPISNEEQKEAPNDPAINKEPTPSKFENTLPSDKKYNIETPPKYGKIEIKINDKGEEEQPNGKYTYSNFDEYKSTYKIETEKCAFREVQLFESIKVLLEGINVYKQFNSKASLSKKKVFDITNQRMTPELCGYGLRELKLDKNLTIIEVRNMKQKGGIFMGIKLI